MKIKSSYNATIVLPPNFPIYPGAEVDYPHWAKHKANPAISWYVDNGHLTLGEDDGSEERQSATEESASDSEPEVDEVVEGVQITEEVASSELSEDEQKEALIAQLAELDIKADKRSSVEKLQEKLDEALAK